MKLTSFLLGGLAVVALAGAPEADAGKKLTLKGSFKFLSDAPLEKIPGTAKGASGVILFDHTDFSKTSGSISVPVANLETGSPSRDEHLHGEAWLDAARNPQLTFTVRSAEATASMDGEVYVAKGTVTGDFTLRGVTKPLTAKFVLKTKGGRAKVDLRFRVALSNYDIKGREGLVGKKVAESIQLRGSLKGTLEEAP